MEEKSIEAEVEAPKGGDETILLAEDKAVLRNWAKQVLETAGYTVITAADGKEAIASFDACPDEIDLLLLDVIMPKLGGQAVLEHVKKDYPDKPVLISSGYAEGTGHTTFVLEEGIQMLSKPYKQDDLLHKIREILDA